MNNAPGKAAQLFERAIAYLTAAQRSPVLQAFEYIGIESALIAEVLGLDRRVVSAWRRGRVAIPPEHHVTLLAYLVVLLSWLFAAEAQLGRHRSPQPLWPQYTESARHLLEMEMRAAPALARAARALADEMDQATRQDAIHVAAQWRKQPSRRPGRRVQAEQQRKADRVSL